MGNMIKLLQLIKNILTHTVGLTIFIVEIIYLTCLALFGQVKKYAQTLLALFLLANFFLGLVVLQEFRFIKNNAVYDMELVREKYVRGMRYYYRSGCLHGTDYYLESNGDNPANFCNAAVQDNIEYLVETELEKLGVIQYGRKRCDDDVLN